MEKDWMEKTEKIVTRLWAKLNDINERTKKHTIYIRELKKRWKEKDAD